MSGPFTAYCYRLVLDGIEHIAMVKVDVLLCLDCFHDGRFVIGHSSIDFLRVDATKEFDDLDGESWTNQETLLLLEAMEIYNENWNEIAEHVGTKSKAQCILHFICLPMEDGPLENIAVPSVSLSSNLSNRDDFERPHSSSNGDSAGSCLEDPDSEHRLPFAYFANPVMALNLNISAARLRTLVIDKCRSLENGIGIETPKLFFFKYSGPVNGFMIDYLNALGEADLDFGFEAEFGEYGDILYDLLRDIGCIRVLTVCSYMLQIISTAEEYPMLKPPLYKMRHLIMKTALHINEYHGISFFLFSCPRLQTLTIHISSSTTIFPEREATLSLAEHEFLSNGYIMVYKCLKRTLKVVNVTGFKGHLNEMLAIQYFIKYGYALETLYINLSNEKGPDGIDMEASYRANAEFLSQIHRASNGLNIFIN